MEIGEPDFDTPEHIKKAAVDALYDNHTPYTPAAGIPLLRETIADYASRFRPDKRLTYTLDNVLRLPGAKPIIWNILSALLDPGGRLRLLRSRLSGVRFGCKLPSSERSRAIPLLESRNWRMDLDELERRVSDKTKAVVINSPHTPTGGVLTRGDLERIAELANRHDFIVIADEIYSRNFYLNTEYVSIAALRRNARAHDHRRRLLESLRDDGAGASLRAYARAFGQDGDALQQQHVQLRRYLRPNVRASPRSPATIRRWFA